jgi:Fic family protein
VHSFQRILESAKPGIPLATTWMLEDLAEFRGKQQLFANQSPERLRVLRESAVIESSLASTRMEQVVVDTSRIGTILFGDTVGRDRNEEEVRGYREALDLIHEEHASLPLTIETLHRLHGLVRSGSGDAGRFKERAEPILQVYPDGRVAVRFQPPEPARAAELLEALLIAWERSMLDRRLPVGVAVAAFNLDFLCIHPYRDGNGRVSRLLLLLQLYHAGFEVGRYVSLERLIEQSKDRYYETLHACSQGWHEGAHDPWPFVDYLLYTQRAAYGEFERRWNESSEPKGSKTARVAAAIAMAGPEFTLTQIERACPGVSRELIRKVLRETPGVRAFGRGPGARWGRVDG